MVGQCSQEDAWPTVDTNGLSHMNEQQSQSHGSAHLCACTTLSKGAETQSQAACGCWTDTTTHVRTHQARTRTHSARATEHGVAAYLTNSNGRWSGMLSKPKNTGSSTDLYAEVTNSKLDKDGGLCHVVV